MGGACKTHGEDEKRIQNLVRKSEGKIQLGRPTCRLEDSIKIDLRRTGLEVKGKSKGKA